MQHNPLLEQENYFKPYEKSMTDLRNQPEALLFDKLCYELFEASETGRKFIEHITQRFLINSQVGRGSPTYMQDVVWQEGFRDAYRMIINHIQSHKQRMKAGA